MKPPDHPSNSTGGERATRSPDAFTPPRIVELAEHPALALTAFIAQELECWRFGIDRELGNGSLLYVRAGEKLLTVLVSEQATREFGADDHAR